jgi:GT2 family glycosyltransferase
MSLEKLPVVAAIPNYNMAGELERLLPQLIMQKYDAIYVLDDASTDHSLDVARSFGDTVSLLTNETNQGAGAARNLLLNRLATTSLIHFIDADSTLESDNMVLKVQELPISDKTGFVGGLVLKEDGNQSIWNYGPRQSIASAISAGYISLMSNLGMNEKAFAPFTQRPNPCKDPIPTEIFWALEANMVIRSDTFDTLGGFDPTVREHDIQPLALKAFKKGLQCTFNPSVRITQHNETNVRAYVRPFQKIKAEWYVTKKYGSALEWLLPFTIKK